MAKQLTTYNGYTSAQLKSRADIPSQADIFTGTTYILCEDVQMSFIKNVIGSGANTVYNVCTSPRVNIYSGFGPVDWYYESNLIKNRPVTPYHLGDFAGYNHNAATPSLTLNSVNLPYTSEWSNVTITGTLNLGEVNWESELSIDEVGIIVPGVNADDPVFGYDLATYTGDSNINISFSGITAPSKGNTDNYTGQVWFINNEDPKGELVSLRRNFSVTVADSIDLYWTGYTYDGNGTLTIVSNINGTLVDITGYDEYGLIYNLTNSSTLTITLDPRYSSYAHITINGTTYTGAQDATLVKTHNVTGGDIYIYAIADDTP